MINISDMLEDERFDEVNEILANLCVEFTANELYTMLNDMYFTFDEDGNEQYGIIHEIKADGKFLIITFTYEYWDYDVDENGKAIPFKASADGEDRFNQFGMTITR